MGDVWKKCARDERWLEHMVHSLYQAVVDEPVPAELLDILAWLPDRSSSNALQRARRWRARAEECQTAAESMGTESARSSLLQMARNYLSLARLAERANDEQSDRERNIG